MQEKSASEKDLPVRQKFEHTLYSRNYKPQFVHFKPNFSDCIAVDIRTNLCSKSTNLY